jgi:acetyltransferase-like isoleucine patch superfamily enzyme
MKQFVKAIVTALAIVLSAPVAALSGFGRAQSAFVAGGHLFSLVPGIPGDYLRVAYYWMTLESSSLRCRISFGAFFSNSRATVAEGVYIGPGCILGRARIGARTQIAANVQILSGARQHARDEHGNTRGSDTGVFRDVSIGRDSWIGAAAIVMADVGERVTIGAGSVVTKPIPDGVVAVGNPARVLQSQPVGESV